MPLIVMRRQIAERLDMTTKTGIQSKGRDLSEIFAPHAGGKSAEPTGYASRGRDLNEIFAPYTGGPKAEPTGIHVRSRDLNEIFAPLVR